MKIHPHYARHARHIFCCALHAIRLGAVAVTHEFSSGGPVRWNTAVDVGGRNDDRNGPAAHPLDELREEDFGEGVVQSGEKVEGDLSERAG